MAHYRGAPSPMASAGGGSTVKKMVVRGPPPGYDHRPLLQPSTLETVRQRYPQLLPMVQAGSLVLLQRPAGYVERRSDGYQEPEEMFVVGTAHVSRQSAEDVAAVVAAVQPDAVVVELCRSRQALMYDTAEVDSPVSNSGSSGSADGSSSGGSMDAIPQTTAAAAAAARAANPMSLSSGSLLGAFQRTLELGGASALVLRLLLAGLSGRVAAAAGVQGGADCRAAREGAEAIGAQIVLGDRPIEITLQRAWEALPWGQRLALVRELAAGGLSLQAQGGLDQATVEALRADDDAISQLFTQLGERYPEVVGPLIHERDLYLAWSLKRSKAVNGAKRVVGVIGKGHLRGVCYALTHDSGELRFRDLVGGKNVKADRQRQRLEAAGRFLLETLVFGGLWYAWQALHPS